MIKRIDLKICLTYLAILIPIGIAGFVVLGTPRTIPPHMEPSTADADCDHSEMYRCYRRDDGVVVQSFSSKVNLCGMDGDRKDFTILTIRDSQGKTVPCAMPMITPISLGRLFGHD